MAASLFLGALYGFFSTHSIIRSIRRIIQTLLPGATQVVAASDQVSSASRASCGRLGKAGSLHSGNFGITRRNGFDDKENAENAEQSNALMDSTAAVVNQASESMSQLVLAMEEVSNRMWKRKKSSRPSMKSLFKPISWP